MLLAGIGLMGAVQDALTGFYLTSGARLIEAMMATAGIIAGVALGISVSDVLEIPLDNLVPGQIEYSDLPTVILGAAVSSAAFSVACYAPRRAVAPIAMITAVAALISQAVELNGFGRAAAAGVAAFFVGLVAYAVAGRVRVPPLVVAVPAIVPFLPGLSIYRGLTWLADGGYLVSQGILALMTAISVAIALASGVILGEYVAQPLKREARKLEDRLAGPRLVGPFRALTRAERRALRKSDESSSVEPAPVRAVVRRQAGAGGREDLVAAGLCCVDHVGRVAVRDLVLGELVLVVDEDLARAGGQVRRGGLRRDRPASPTAGSRRGRGRRRAARCRPTRRGWRCRRRGRTRCRARGTSRRTSSPAARASPRRPRRRARDRAVC